MVFSFFLIAKIKKIFEYRCVTILIMRTNSLGKVAEIYWGIEIAFRVRETMLYAVTIKAHTANIGRRSFSAYVNSVDCSA